MVPETNYRIFPNDLSFRLNLGLDQESLHVVLQLMGQG